MNRREFIRRSVPVTAIPFLINGFPIRAYGRAPFLETLVAAASATDRVLVLVQLGGGNDGINTVIPLNQDSVYMNARPNIAIPLNEVLTLRDDVGLHPVMTGMKDLYDQGKLSRTEEYTDMEGRITDLHQIGDFTAVAWVEGTQTAFAIGENGTVARVTSMTVTLIRQTPTGIWFRGMVTLAERTLE